MGDKEKKDIYFFKFYISTNWNILTGNIRQSVFIIFYSTWFFQKTYKWSEFSGSCFFFNNCLWFLNQFLIVLWVIPVLLANSSFCDAVIKCCFSKNDFRINRFVPDIVVLLRNFKAPTMYWSCEPCGWFNILNDCDTLCGGIFCIDIGLKTVLKN